MKQSAAVHAPGEATRMTFQLPARHDATADDELMRRVQDGQVEALATLFDRYQAPLFNFYLRLTGDRAASEDLVQEVFFRVLKYRHTYQAGSRFATWLYHVARNARLDYWRKRKAEVSIDDQPEPAVAPSDSAETGQTRQLLRRALALLPADKREILVLSRFQNLPYQEIAVILGCETGTVKVRVHRALQELRRIFMGLTGRI